MIYDVIITNKYKKDYKLSIKRGKDISRLNYVVNEIVNGRGLEPKYKDHVLTGNYSGYRECHIESDWLLIYKINDDILILTLVRIGTHADLF